MVTSRYSGCPPSACSPVGLDAESGLLPYPANAFSGYRLLQEYFALPEKFHFFDLVGLEFLAEVPWVDRLQISFRFSRPIEDYLRVRAEHVRLHCTPIVNLFPQDGDPVRLAHRQNEYRVRPHSQEPRFFEVFSVDRVSGAIQGTGRNHQFTEFESFQHEHDWDDEMAGYYRLRLASTVVGRGVETYISFVTEGGNVGMPPMETVSLELTCTNRNLPELLRVGEIDRHSDDSPEFTKFRNIAKVSPSLAPPLDARLHWRLVSNMALNYMSLLNVDALREILATYDFRTYVGRAGQARLGGAAQGHRARQRGADDPAQARPAGARSAHHHAAAREQLRRPGTRRRGRHVHVRHRAERIPRALCQRQLVPRAARARHRAQRDLQVAPSRRAAAAAVNDGAPEITRLPRGRRHLRAGRTPFQLLSGRRPDREDVTQCGQARLPRPLR
jgi:type VI secretion system VasI/ImpG family protein